jgi:DNA-binding XRE family transcriptional regulator
MIKNEKQLKISKKKLVELEQKLVDTKATKELSTLKKKMIAASLENLTAQLRAEIEEYESISNGQSISFADRELADLPKLIMAYKIQNKLTQKTFSKQLGIKEQQLQRYESDDFSKMSFQNMLNLLQKIKLNVKISKSEMSKKGKHLMS